MTFNAKEIAEKLFDCMSMNMRLEQCRIHLIPEMTAALKDAYHDGMLKGLAIAAEFESRKEPRIE